MSYEPPSGWVESRAATSAGAARRVFHLDPGCELVRSDAALKRVERPGEAARCVRCADLFADVRSLTSSGGGSGGRS